MRPLLLLSIVALTAACSTLPETQPLPAAREAAHSVAEIQPGRWYVMVRVNYFAPETEAENFLRRRAAALCPGKEPVIEKLRVVTNPHQASAEIYCRESTPSEIIGNGETETHTATPVARIESRPLYPVPRISEERLMVMSGPGTAGMRPEPGVIPPFTQQISDHDPTTQEPVPVAQPATEKTTTAAWMPATNEARQPRYATVSIEDLEDLAEEPVESGSAGAFWPAVGSTYRNLIAEVE